MKIEIPSDYKSTLDIFETEIGIKFIKDTFQRHFVESLHLTRVSAPLFVRANSGLNDDLTGIERPISFKVNDEDLEIIHSLAKWKRMVMRRYTTEVGFGIYTDMNAIRKDEDLDPLHSIYVDQWDWEKIIDKKDRNYQTLEEIVKLIYQSIYKTSLEITRKFPKLKNYLKDDIYFISSSELALKYPTLSNKEREKMIVKEYGSVFISKIGGILDNGEPSFDKRAPDYDDWDLNGDILVYYPPLDCAIELSSMGIRVDADKLIKQLKISNHEERLKHTYHQDLLAGKLPDTIGGGIGQSRLCLVLLNKVHIGEVQSSYWDKKTIAECKAKNIRLL